MARSGAADIRQDQPFGAILLRAGIMMNGGPEWEEALRLVGGHAVRQRRSGRSRRHRPPFAAGKFDVEPVLAAVQARYAGRGVEVVEVAAGWQFRTAPDLAPQLTRVVAQPRPSAAGRDGGAGGHCLSPAGNPVGRRGGARRNLGVRRQWTRCWRPV